MMPEVVKALPPEVLQYIDLIVWNITRPEGFERKNELKAGCPSLFIDGQVVYNNTIPLGEDLLNRVHEFLKNSSKKS